MKCKLFDCPPVLGCMPQVNLHGAKADPAMKTVVNPVTKRLAVVWCQGCGEFHGFPEENLAGDVDNPSTKEPVRIDEITQPTRRGRVCVFTIKDGVMSWDKASTHRLAGEARAIPHEEAWSVHSPDQKTQPVAPEKPEVKS